MTAFSYDALNGSATNQSAAGIQVGTTEATSVGIYAGSGSSSTITAFLGFAVALVFVVLLAYFSLRLIGRARGGVKADRNIKIIEAIGVGVQSTIQLIKVGDKFFLIGVSRGNIVSLGEVDAESVTIEQGKNPSYVSFDKVLSKILPKKKGEEQDSSNE
ncbi:MAG: flagellar biosynthetic protein FliO [Defluviitaleaceae bacterium]|nr:flagellar biosynthetic protein FliO [Defluviitaleaceae bacterium]